MRGFGARADAGVLSLGKEGGFFRVDAGREARGEGRRRGARACTCRTGWGLPNTGREGERTGTFTGALWQRRDAMASFSAIKRE